MSTRTTAALGLALAAVAVMPACGEHQQSSPAARAVISRALSRFVPLARQARDALPLVRGEDAIRPGQLRAGEPALSNGWRRPVHRLDLELPLSADGVTRISSGPVTLELRAVGARGAAAEVVGGAVIYRDAYPNAHSIVLAEQERMEEFILLADKHAPRRMEYALRVTRGGGRVRQLEHTVEVLDGQGNAWIRLAPPYLVDGAGRRHEVSGALDSGRLVLEVPPGVTRFPALLDPGWVTTGSTSGRHASGTATLLKTGKVLVAGGTKSKQACELYHPTYGIWSKTGSMITPRYYHTATLLKTGNVLLVGAQQSNTTAELYDPAAGKWSATGKLNHGRKHHTATLLPSGAVLVVGGESASRSAELYDPATGVWTKTGNTVHKRAVHGAGLLPSGKVIVAGGRWAETSSEIYDPASGSWTIAGSLPGQFEAFRIKTVQLNSGGVLLVSPPLAAIYDPTTGAWSANLNMHATRKWFAATLVASGAVWVTGGLSSKAQSVQVLSPAQKAWQLGPPMLSARSQHTATVLPAGSLLVAGPSYSAEVYDVTTGTPCQKGADCFSGFCADGICCDSACAGECRSCLVKGGLGLCTLFSKGAVDPATTSPCSGQSVCDGKGACKLKVSNACTTASQCLSGNCADGRCCDDACDGVCVSCALAGSPGKCANVALGSPDLMAKAPCTGNKVCDGAGVCLLADGQSCNGGAQCASKHCLDGVCCATNCTSTCTACNLPGTLGKCAFIPTGQTDPGGAPACTGGNVCDGKGACKKASASACATAAVCASGFCADGVCCDKACGAACLACNLTGAKGTCSPVSAGKQDPSAKVPCMGTAACDGAGTCVKGQGQPCTAGAQCVTGHCADGVCCDAACTGTCQACNTSGKAGTCAAVAKGQSDAIGTSPCAGDNACDGLGKCLTRQGKACTSAMDCLVGFCRDGVCCDKACDKVCESCALSGSVGTCAFVPAKTYSKSDCQGKDPQCGGLCDGAGKCDYPSLGTTCGLCRACDGTGRCSGIPQDDTSCGVIDCDKLDTSCRDYHDLKVQRCGSLGQCKKANTFSACAKYTELQCDAGASDATPLVDRGQGADVAAQADRGTAGDRGAGADVGVPADPGAAADGGCGCQADPSPSPAGLSLTLLIAGLGLAARRRYSLGPGSQPGRDR